MEPDAFMALRVVLRLALALSRSGTSTSGTSCQSAVDAGAAAEGEVVDLLGGHAD